MIYGDVRGCTSASVNFGPRRPESVDMITGGFPCQDVSLMGKQKGLRSQRSGLFYQLCRLSDVLQPKFLFLENAPALVKHLDKILIELHRRGIDARWTTLVAGNLGAPHYRNRLFILACKRKGSSSRGLPESFISKRRDSRYVSNERCFSIADWEARKVRMSQATGARRKGKCAQTKA